ncbi:CLUMA_CG011205, isoform A [Clunio marinus]|uniref:Multiple inositol polyphosphate phosphatase 1 n=1 Tax=Clunio marinus TaxID=568069 RepID=A0A1J1IC25_9DIPT|nr:CLUMA_CG011205, isoform A [Clunio marinus]
MIGEKVRDAVLENFKRYDRDRHLNQLCSDDLELLKKWRFDQNLTAAYAEYLTVQGWNDMKYMAIEFQRTFQNLIEPRFSRDKFKFGFTDTQRTEASYKAFAEGLFGPNAEGVINAKAESNQSILLRPYEACPEFLKQEERAKDQNSEYSKFMNSDVYKKVFKVGIYDSE